MPRGLGWDIYCDCILVLSILIIITSIIIGSSSCVKEKHDYKSTICFVTNYTIIEHNCSIQECHSREIRQQQIIVDHICYLQIYFVTYNVSDGRKLQSTAILTDEPPGPYEVSIRFLFNFL
jgi:hypothetical protein